MKLALPRACRSLRLGIGGDQHALVAAFCRTGGEIVTGARSQSELLGRLLGLHAWLGYEQARRGAVPDDQKGLPKMARMQRQMLDQGRCTNAHNGAHFSRSNLGLSLLKCTPSVTPTSKQQLRRRWVGDEPSVCHATEPTDVPHSGGAAAAARARLPSVQYQRRWALRLAQPGRAEGLHRRHTQHTHEASDARFEVPSLQVKQEVYVSKQHQLSFSPPRLCMRSHICSA